MNFLTAGDKRHSSKKAERRDIRSAGSMRDLFRRKRRAARKQALAWYVVRKRRSGDEMVRVGQHRQLSITFLSLSQHDVTTNDTVPMAALSSSMSQLLSSAVISAVGLTCKAFLNSGLCSITVSNLPTLLDALRSERTGQGLVTGVCQRRVSVLPRRNLSYSFQPSVHVCSRLSLSILSSSTLYPASTIL